MKATMAAGWSRTPSRARRVGSSQRSQRTRRGDVRLDHVVDLGGAGIAAAALGGRRIGRGWPADSERQRTGPRGAGRIGPYASATGHLRPLNHPTWVMRDRSGGSTLPAIHDSRRRTCDGNLARATRRRRRCASVPDEAEAGVGRRRLLDRGRLRRGRSPRVVDRLIAVTLSVFEPATS